jgi:hypothetical protein
MTRTTSYFCEVPVQYENEFHGYKAITLVVHSPTGDGTHTFTATTHKINGVQVAGARQTGWTAMTGSADKSTTYAVGSVTLLQLAGRVKALQDAMTLQGQIGA